MAKEQANNLVSDSPEGWDYPFSAAQVKSWKATYGEVSVAEDLEGNTFVLRGLGRKEYNQLNSAQYRNEQDYENKFVEQIVLFPELTEMKVRQMDAGSVKTLFSQIAPLSYVDAGQTTEAIEFNPAKHGPLLIGTEKTDWRAWQAASRGRKLFFCELQGVPFVYKNLSRSQYETYRIKTQTDGADQESAENVVCTEAVIYPLADSFDSNSNQFFYGTISSLAVLVMKQSGFGKALKVVKL